MPIETPQIKTDNRFFLKLVENHAQHNGDRIFFMTHAPKNLSIDDALTLAADLVKLAGGPEAFTPYLLKVMPELAPPPVEVAIVTK